MSSKGSLRIYDATGGGTETNGYRSGGDNASRGGAMIGYGEIYATLANRPI